MGVGAEKRVSRLVKLQSELDSKCNRSFVVPSLVPLVIVTLPKRSTKKIFAVMLPVAQDFK
jgi:hypothetical protein